MKKIAITDFTFPDLSIEETVLRPEGIEVVSLKAKRSPAEPIVLLRDVARIVLVLLVGGWSAIAAAEPAPPDMQFFEMKVHPVLVERCYKCHSHEKKIKGGLVLDSRSGWEKGGESGAAIVPGKPEESLLIKAVRHEDEDLQMPEEKLSDDEIAVLEQWVKMGAPDPRVAKQTSKDLAEGRKHWAFQPVTHPAVPESAFPEISRTPIDAFLFAAMSKHNLRPATRADRGTLLRRATLDLTGLPPTAEALTAFVHDPQPDDAAFAQVVERLLASSAYGEKWGRYWLDIVHYADTTGCSSDWPIDDMWRYRDWVIAAFNDDKPFDRFLTEQLAGDLLAADMLKQTDALDEKVYRERIVATGFLASAKRFGSSPGADEHLTIDDSIDTTFKALQGLTMSCARCHDHKFDPLPASDYFSLYGIFASSLYPYAGAEINRYASLLVPLAPPGKIENVLDAWNRSMPSSGGEKAKAPRSVQASFIQRWGFEDNETGSGREDRLPATPWVSKGGVTVMEGNSPFVHLLPKGGINHVYFQATAHQGEMMRRVRWQDERSDVRSLAVDFQLTSPWDESGHRWKLAWRSQDEPAEELELATIAALGLSAPGGAKAVLLAKGRWYHLVLVYALDSSTLTLRLWDEKDQLLADFRLPSAVATKLRAAGDLIVRFEADAVNDTRQTYVRIDNIVADSGRLPAPGPADVLPVRGLVAADETGAIAKEVALNERAAVVAVMEEAKRAEAEAQKAQAAEREAVYRRVITRKPETAFAMWEGTPRDVAIQKRGEPTSPGVVVPRRNLAVLGGQPVEHPNRESGRRDLARWMLDESNPLTLRVFVNRLWQGHFGRGIVATSNNFGHKGEAPSHPALLDYLVGRFRKNGLSTKAMHREIMLTHAYRQSSVPAAGTQERDPDNRWLSHFSPRRLTAEELRDSVLFVAGMLDYAGPGYRQPFPPLIERNWSQHNPFSPDYEANYRRDYDHRKRSLYLPVVRLVPDPFLSTFDLADSNQSIAMRGEIAVPLQGLALMNAPFIVEAANTLAAKQASDADAVGFLYRRILGIAASETTKNKLAAHLAMMTTEQGLKPDEALAVIAQSLMASNAFLYVF